MITHKRKNQGFTLIELMITLAIIAILAAIAYPGYLQHVQRTRRNDAEGKLTELANFMERNYTISHRYDKDSADKAIALPSMPTNYYQFSLKDVSQTSYTLQAEPKGPQTSDTYCGTLTLDYTGKKTPPTSGCW